MRDAGDGLSERGKLFRLQQLVVQVACLVLEALALADVAHQGLDANALARRFRMRRDPPILPIDRRGAGAEDSR